MALKEYKKDAYPFLIQLPGLGGTYESTGAGSHPSEQQLPEIQGNLSLRHLLLLSLHCATVHHSMLTQATSAGSFKLIFLHPILC